MRVATNPQSGIGTPSFHTDALASSERLDGFHTIVQELLKLQLLALNLEAPSFDAGGIEQVGDQFVHALGSSAHALDQWLQALVSRRHLGSELLGGHRDHPER